MGYPHEVTFKVKLAIIQTRVFYTKKEHIDMCSYIISVVYMSYHILFEGVCFVLSHPTHIWNAYVAESFLEIIEAKNEACL